MGIVAKLIMFVSAYKPNKPQRRVILHEEREPPENKRWKSEFLCFTSFVFVHVLNSTLIRKI